MMALPVEARVVLRGLEMGFADRARSVGVANECEHDHHGE
jgi:hypothetical protein